MSNALDYLARVRPEAAEHYLKFLKESGRHLDDKTRFLISVVTKVIAGSETGFRQYLPHALQSGATADEVIDAILCAFPAAGLTRVLKAIDWVLEMDLPEFRPENLGRTAEWHEVAELVALHDGRALFLVIDDRQIFVFKTGETIRVYDPHCSHHLTGLTEVELKDNTLTCPVHGWVFDLETGDCIAKGRRPLKSFETKIEEGKLFARW
ncbi:MAG: Rieske 2Fe-2S domain-containing protein [Thermodesulfovibrionales bacterium]|jgi:nitrite reductase/ring-hydroxylating ferredoxin subunit/alkylhydroperoxidase/carboxymuconolactone decarboxylase family protein YurZ